MFDMDTTLNYELDKDGMKEAIVGFSQQISDAFQIMENWSPNHEYSQTNQVLILGMGGSAIGGDVARVIVQDNCNVPIFVNRSYNIPAWVNEKTLVLASSYSGGTEETLSAYAQCVERNCKIIALSTGGELTDLVKSAGMDIIKVPAGFQPRAALGYSFSLILLLLNKLRFVSNEILIAVEKSIPALNSLSSALMERENSALKLAEQIYNTCPVIYGSEDLTWVAALRFRGQLAENAKMLAFHHHFPEQNHNEIEGWTVNPEIMKRLSIVWLKDEEDHAGTKARMEISSQLLESFPETQLIVSQSGANRIERLLKLIHFTDWISYYAALLNNVDPTPVKRIQELKLKLAELS